MRVPVEEPLHPAAAAAVAAAARGAEAELGVGGGGERERRECKGGRARAAEHAQPGRRRRGHMMNGAVTVV